MENNQPNIPRLVLFAALVLMVLLILIRIPPVFRMLLYLAAVGLAIGLFVLARYWWQNRKNIAYSRTEKGMADQRIAYCEEQIEKNENELAEINENKRELIEKMTQPDISSRNYDESKKLVQAFSSEAKLREQKIAFFRVCIGKLRRLKHNHDLSETIAEKRKKLDEFKENHYDDLADLEELKTELEMSTTYLETIETLSLRMLESTDYDQAKSLHLELQEMTRNLEEL